MSEGKIKNYPADVVFDRRTFEALVHDIMFKKSQTEMAARSDRADVINESYNELRITVDRLWLYVTDGRLS